MLILIIFTIIVFSLYLVVGISPPSIGISPKIEKSMRNLYLELSCDPETPTKFTCTDFYNRDPNMCYAFGNTYEVGEKIDLGPETDPCYPVVDCTCEFIEYTGKVAISCGFFVVDCAAIPEIPENCWYGYSFISCCSASQYCNEPCGSKYPTCCSNGQTVKFNQLILPDSEPCYRCLCTNNFRDSPDVKNNPACRRTNCYYAVNGLDQLDDGCAPIFNEGTCCAYQYRCPSENDVVIPAPSPNPEAGKCKFGDKSLNVGDRLEKIDGIDCVCAIPPMLTCTQEVSVQ